MKKNNQIQIRRGSADLNFQHPPYISLSYCATKATEHHNRVIECWQSGLKHAKVAGNYLRDAKKQTGHGKWLWWLKRNCPIISERTAQVYMTIAKRWKELEPNPNLSINEALKTLTTRKGNSKKFNPDEILRARLMREILRVAWKNWESEDIEYLKTNLAWDPELEDLIVDAMEKLRKAIRRQRRG